MWKLAVGGLVGIFICFQYACGQTLNTVNRVANNLGVKYAMRTNFAVVGQVPHSVAILTLTNKGKEQLPSSGYSIFFCHDNFLFPVSYQEELGKYETAPYGGVLLVDGYEIRFIHGCMYEMKALDAAIEPKTSKNITLYFSPFSVSKYDAFRNWYVVDDASNFKMLPDTRNLDFVEAYETPLNQLRRTFDLDSVPLEPQDRQNMSKSFAVTDANGVIPKPRVQIITPNATGIDVKTPGIWKISSRHKALNEAKKYLAAETNIELDDVAPSLPKTIELNLKPGAYFPTHIYGPFSEEAYEIKINNNKIEINGATKKGVTNGIHTFISLQAWGQVNPQTIRDGPRFSERGLKLDIASNFYGVAKIKKIIDLMAYFKLNRLYLQIWNNHGLRLDLGFGAAEIAGRRCHDPEEKTCLFTQLGSKPDGSGKGNGYLTISEFKNLLKYAENRNIMIVPSVNVGDDARAMVVGMHQSKLKSNSGISLFDPTEVEDLRMSGRYPGKDNAINPCRRETLVFVRELLRYFKALYTDAKQKLDRLHFNSDFNTEQMMSSKHCFPIPPRNISELQEARSNLTLIKAQFLMSLGAIFEKEQINLSGSVDFFTAFPDNQNVTRMTIMDKEKRYKNIDAYVINDDYMRFDPPSGREPMKPYSNRAQLLKNNGYKVLVSPPHKTKLDTAYEPDPNAPGDYSVATRNVSLREAFAWAPNSRCCNLNLAPEGVANEVTKHSCLVGPLCDPFSNGNTGFDGTMATIDTRKLPDAESALKLLSPRLMAFAERSWSEAPWEASYTEATPFQYPTGQPPVQPIDPTPTVNVNFADQEQDYQRFRSILGNREVVRLAFKGLPVYCSAPGARVVKQGGVPNLQSSCMYPNMLLFAKSDAGQYEELKTVPNKNVTIKCMYYLEKYRSLFDCQEQRFDAKLDKTPHQHVSDSIKDEIQKRVAEDEARRQAALAQQAFIARRQAEFIQQQRALAQQQAQQQAQQGRQDTGAAAQQNRGVNRQAGLQRQAGQAGVQRPVGQAGVQRPVGQAGVQRPTGQGARRFNG